jgi:hypothetical protein
MEATRDRVRTRMADLVHTVEVMGEASDRLAKWNSHRSQLQDLITEVQATVLGAARLRGMNTALVQYELGTAMEAARQALARYEEARRRALEVRP